MPSPDMPVQRKRKRWQTSQLGPATGTSGALQGQPGCCDQICLLDIQLLSRTSIVLMSSGGKARLQGSFRELCGCLRRDVGFAQPLLSIQQRQHPVRLLCGLHCLRSFRQRELLSRNALECMLCQSQPRRTTWRVSRDQPFTVAARLVFSASLFYTCTGCKAATVLCLDDDCHGQSLYE